MHLHSGDGLDPKDYGPWSYKPLCTSPLEKLNGETLGIYTSTDFNSGHGLSIVTTPSLSKIFASLPSLQNPTAFNKTSAPTSPTSAIYTPRLTTSGSTMLAHRTYARGDLITAELPLVVVISETALSWEERESLLQTAVARLPEETQREFEGMASHFEGEEAVFRLPRLVGILATNAGSQVVVGGRVHFAMYPPTFATLNFACSPNTQFRVDPETLVVSLRAARSIAEGEELSTSYYPESQREVHFLPFGERQKRILEFLFFNCSCPRCKLGDAKDSDLREVREFQKLLEDGQSTPSVEEALRLIGLYEREGLDAFLDIPYGIAAAAFNAAGDLSQVKKFASLAVEIRGRHNGVVLESDEQIKEWKALIVKSQG